MAAAASKRRFWKPGTIAPGLDIERSSEGQGKLITYNANCHLSLRQQRLMLPIARSKRALLWALEKHRVVVVVGETGSGKTTQIPQYLHEGGWTAGNRGVACTQPRRVAATTVACRVAKEMQVELGVEVGYSIRFEDRSDSHRTLIKYLTDGMLLRETMLDPLLTRYSVIMLDEAHERSLHTDLLIGLLKKILTIRKDLRVIISSATLDAQLFKDFYETNRSGRPEKDTVCILSVEGRQHPVDSYFTRRAVKCYLTAAVESVLHIHEKEKSGDILLFLTGRHEIDETVTRLKKGPPQLLPLPFYSGLPREEQEAVFKRAPPGRRKVIVSTNVAETSVTIPNIVFVIDAGFAKLRMYSPLSGNESLVVTPISRASACQRAGRAGRVRRGKCFRLYTEDAFYNAMASQTVPEIQRSNLTFVILQLKALGIRDVLHFPFVSPPPVEIIEKALELLYALGALNEYCELTSPIGTTLAEFPVEPRMARMLFKAGELGCAEEALSIAAVLSVQSVFVIPRQFRGKASKAWSKYLAEEGDHITLLNVYNSFCDSGKDPSWCKEHYISYRALRRANEIRRQLRRYLLRFNIPIESCEDHNTILSCVVTGFFSNAAQLQPSGEYKTVREGELLTIHPTSTLAASAPAWVVYHDVIETTKKFMREVSAIQPMWLAELAPGYYQYRGVDVDKLAGDSSKEEADRKKRRVLF